MADNDLRPQEPPKELPPSPAGNIKHHALKLTTILQGLRDNAHPMEQAPGPEAAGSEPSPRKAGRVLSDLSLGEIVDQTRHAGFGFLAAFLALVAVPFMGLSLPFGLAIAFLGMQMLAGRNRPWLPRRLRSHQVSISTLDWLSLRVARWTSGVERWVRPRWMILSRGPFWRLVGFGLVFQGVGLALPIPLPASNWIFIVPILIYGIGLLEDDGLLIMLGHAVTSVMMLLMVLFWEAVHAGFLRILAHWHLL